MAFLEKSLERSMSEIEVSPEMSKGKRKIVVKKKKKKGGIPKNLDVLNSEQDEWKPDAKVDDIIESPSRKE